MRRLLVVLIVFTVFLTQVPIALATLCPGRPEIAVLYADEESEARICEASGQALDLLAGFGLTPKRRISIEIIQEGINHLGYMAFGSYDVRTDTIRLMSYRSIFEKYAKPEMYGEPFDRIHYSGAIVHEITHAVFHQHSTAEAPGPAPQEYLAHVMQLSSLPEKRRSRILREHDESAWESGDAISDIYMALEPSKFAVKSYNHFVMMADPRVFIDTLLKAKWFYVYIP